MAANRKPKKRKPSKFTIMVDQECQNGDCHHLEFMHKPAWRGYGGCEGKGCPCTTFTPRVVVPA